MSTMEPPFRPLALHLRNADTFLAIAATLVAELEPAGYPGIALIALAATGAPTVWASNPYFERQAGLAYLLAGHCGDPALAAMRTSHTPAGRGRTWMVPILSCGELIGSLRLVSDDDRDRRAELTVLGSMVSVRFAQLGVEGPLDQHVRSALTQRQHEVAYLVSRGCTNPEIASMLKVSANAVKKHVSRVLEVMGISNRTELAAIAGRWSANPASVGALVLVELDNPAKPRVHSRSAEAA